MTMSIPENSIPVGDGWREGGTNYGYVTGGPVGSGWGYDAYLMDGTRLGHEGTYLAARDLILKACDVPIEPGSH